MGTGVIKDNTIKHRLKLIRWKLRRELAALRWGKDALAASPAVFGNAMPKSGSHLIIQVLQGLTRIGPFVNPGMPPVNRTEDNRDLSPETILREINDMLPGDIRYGYINAEPVFVQALTGDARATLFVYRDPRDMIVSHVFYAAEMFPGHGMHRYYKEKLNSMEERINAAILGVNNGDVVMRGVRSRYEGYLGWLEQPGILCLKFEELILDQKIAFQAILDYLREHGVEFKIPLESQIAALRAAVVPHRSGTFRRGQPGNWREYFTERNKGIFKEQAGDLLIRLGYETGMDW